MSAASGSRRSRRLNLGIKSKTRPNVSLGSNLSAPDISIMAVSEGVFIRRSSWPMYFSL